MTPVFLVQHRRVRIFSSPVPYLCCQLSPVILRRSFRIADPNHSDKQIADPKPSNQSLLFIYLD